MRPILIRPENLGKGSAYHYSDQIINGLRTEKELSVIGFGNAISLGCMAVQISTRIANVYINELSLDYVGAPALGISGVFFVLGKKSKVDWEEEKRKLESKMKLTFEHEGQLIVVSRKLSPDKMVPLCLSKLARSESLKITAAGTSINRAASLTLELTKGDITKEPVGIRLVTLSTIEFEAEPKKTLGTGMEIYLKKGACTTYSEKHKQILRMLQRS